MDDLKWLVEHGWTHVMLTYWPADEEHGPKWMVRAERSQEVDNAGWETKLWQWGDTPEKAIANLRARAEMLQVI